MELKVWLDDERDPKNFKGWEDAVWVTTPEDAIYLLENREVTSLSLDNDLGLDPDENGTPRDGYIVATWIEERTITDPDYDPPATLNAHTANPPAMKKMDAAFRSIRQAERNR